MPGGDGTGPIWRGWGWRRPAYGYPAYGYGRGLRWRTDHLDEKTFLMRELQSIEQEEKMLQQEKDRIRERLNNAES
jgi:hypothetical protein